MNPTSCQIGALVPEPSWTASLIGLYPRAVSFLHPDGALISIVRDSADMEARALWFEDSHSGPFAFLQQHSSVQHGVCQLEWREDSLLIRAYNTSGAQFPICRRQAYSGKASVEKARQLWQKATVAGRQAARLRSIDLIALAYQRGKSREGIHGPTVFGRHFRSLQSRPDWPVNLVGFGPGTTPAGDDWLAGYLMALDLTTSGQTEETPALRAEIHKRLTVTNAAGRTLLMAILAGEPCAWLGRLLMACAAYAAAASQPAVSYTGSLHTLSEQVQEALAHGATSGEDTLSGLLAGLLLQEEK